MSLRLEDDLFDVRGYATGDECLAKGADFDPDVILLDITDGIETCRRLKQMPALESVPVVFVIPRDDDPSTVEPLVAGANDFLSRDASQPVLIARLGSQIAISRMQRQLRKLSK